jgi:GNAT superfamily N-acetyltransferase
MSPLAIRILDSDSDIVAAFRLMSLLRDRVKPETFLAEVRRQQRDGYELIGGFVDGALVALAGSRRTHTLSRGEHVFVDDLVTDPDHRGEGHGTAMLAWIAARAKAAGVPRVYLDSRHTAKGFYEQVGFTMMTSIPCWIDVERLISVRSAGL